jgi:hypothetical protein
MANEKAMYEILIRRGNVVPVPPYDEYLEAAKEVIAGIRPEQVTPIEEMLSSIETRIATRRAIWNFSYMRGPVR